MHISDRFIMNKTVTRTFMLKQKNQPMKTIYFKLIFAALLFAAGCDSSPTGIDSRQTVRHDIVLDTTFVSPTDSLEYLVNNIDMPAFDRMCIYEQLSYEFSKEDFEKAVHYATLGSELSLKEKNDSITGKIYGNLGLTYKYNLMYELAIEYFDKALYYALQTKDENLESSLYCSYSILYADKRDYKASLEYYDKAKRLAEKNGDYRLLATITHNVGLAFYTTDSYEQAIQYLLKSIDIKNTKVENPSLTEMSADYFALSLTYNALDRNDEALEASQKSLHYARAANSKFSEVRALIGSASIYANDKKEYDKAIETANRALTLADEIGSDLLKADCLYIIGLCYINKKDFSKGEGYLLQALDIIGYDTQRRKEIMKGLLEAYVFLKESDKVLTIFNEYDSLTVALNNQDVQYAISEIETRNETEKKQNEIERQQNIISRQLIQRRLLVATGIVLFLGLAVALLLMRSIVQKRRLAEKQRQLAEQEIVRLEQEKRLIATQAVLDGETAERARLARDLHDGLGGKLTVVKLNLEELKQGVQLDTAAMTQFDKAMFTLNESVMEMRRVSHNLMPDTLIRKGLRPAVDDLCRTMSSKIVFNHYGAESRLDPKLEVLIYRCIHELVNNALKYAGATQIMVQIVQEDDNISFTVQDDGCGFDPTTASDGTGLQNIRTRVASFGGDIQIDSKAGEGTEVNVDLKI